MVHLELELLFGIKKDSSLRSEGHLCDLSSRTKRGILAELNHYQTRVDFGIFVSIRYAPQISILKIVIEAKNCGGEETPRAGPQKTGFLSSLECEGTDRR